MKKHIISVLVLSLFVLVSVSTAEGNGTHRGWQQGKGNGFGRQNGGPDENQRGFGLFAKLNLTQQQKENNLEKFQNLEKETLQYRQKIEALKLTLSSEMKKDNPDKRTVRDIIRDINANRTIVQQKRIETIIDIKAGLTKEQKQKLNETSFKFKER
jgi:Spy/CpxP family protein refolding chaperone